LVETSGSRLRDAPSVPSFCIVGAATSRSLAAIVPPMTLQHLRDLMAVLNFGGFRSAARELSVSQAGLTKSVSALEDECGFALLTRSAKGVALTPEGEGFLPHAQAILGEAERAEEWIRHAGRPRPESVAIGVSIDPSLHLAPAVLADFRRAMPDVTVHVSQGAPSELLAALRDNRLELAVMRLPEHMPASDMRIDMLYDSSAAVVARKGHPLAGATSVRELMDLQWVIVGDPARPGADDASIRELFTEQRLGRPRVATVCNSLFGALSLLVESDFVARLPKPILDHPLAARLLTEIAVREQAPGLCEIALVRKASRRLGREAQLLASMLQSFARVHQTMGTVAPPADARALPSRRAAR
jgi:DNA-binding transcriptional LysR family regulator